MRRNARRQQNTALLESNRKFGNPNDPDRPRPASVPLSKILSLAEEDKGQISLGLFMLLLSSICNLSLPKIAGDVVDVVSLYGMHPAPQPQPLPLLLVTNATQQKVPSGNPAKDDPDGGQQELLQACLTLLVVGAIGGLCSGARGYIFTVCGERLAMRLRKRLYNSILSQETGFFDSSRTGELINRISADTQVIQSALTVNISMLVRGLFQAVIAITMIFLVSWQLSLIMMAIIPIIVFIGTRFGKFVKRVQGEVQDALAEATQAADEAISSIRTVRSFSREDAEMARYGECVNQSFLLGRSLAMGYGSVLATMSFCVQSAIATVLYFGGTFVIQGQMSVGELTSFLMYVIFVGASFGILSAVYGDFMKAVGASARVFELLERKPTIQYKGGTLLAPAAQAELSIIFSHVYFSYPTRSDVPVLNDFCLTVAPGSVVALVGTSGGGKSTVFQLLERFYLPASGDVLVGNTRCVGNSKATEHRTHARGWEGRA